jgi:hypothetical protein
MSTIITAEWETFLGSGWCYGPLLVCFSSKSQILATNTSKFCTFRVRNKSADTSSACGNGRWTRGSCEKVPVVSGIQFVIRRWTKENLRCSRLANRFSHSLLFLEETILLHHYTNLHLHACTVAQLQYFSIKSRPMHVPHIPIFFLLFQWYTLLGSSSG